MERKTAIRPRWILPGIIVLTLSLILAACVIRSKPEPAGDPVEQAMQTLQAQATQEYYQTAVAQMTETAPAATAEPTVNPTNINQPPTETTPPQQNTQVPTVGVTQVAATATPVVLTATPAPPTPTPIPCYQVKFVEDLNIPDGTKIVAGTHSKSWHPQQRLLHLDNRFDIAFVDGANDLRPLGHQEGVKPGETLISPSR